MVRSSIRSASIKTDDEDLPVMIAARFWASESVILYLSLTYPEGIEYLHKLCKM